MCVGARGEMSRIATTRSSSCSLSAGISPATIRQKRQSVDIAAAAVSLLIPGSPEYRLGAHQEPDRPDEASHQVGHVALPLRALEPRLVVGCGPDADQPAEVR